MRNILINANEMTAEEGGGEGAVRGIPKKPSKFTMKPIPEITERDNFLSLNLVFVV